MAVRYILKAAPRVPNYPGRQQLEALLRPWAMRYSAQVVQRLLGYWLMRQHLEGGRAELVERGWMSRAATYHAEADFRAVFGVSVEDFELDLLPKFLFGDQDHDAEGRHVERRGGWEQVQRGRETKRTG